MKNLDNQDIKNKKIILRVDLNVPVLDGHITEKSRIIAIKETLNKLIKFNNKIFLISHFGRPKGKIDKKYSLEFICSDLKKELNLNNIYFLENLNQTKIIKMIDKMNYGEVCLIENIRFNPKEEKNDLNFAKEISENFDIFVNDAFSCCHRNHASIVSIPKFLPSYAGYGLLKEIKNIDSFVKNAKKPNLGIIGGSKISTKINLLYNLINTCDVIIIGGAMANTFIGAQGFDIGKSLCEKNLFKTALSILSKAKKYNCKIIIPKDVICADSLSDNVNIQLCDIDNINSNQMILDIGIQTTNLILKYVLESRMILWNGPLGAFEYKPFDKSSLEIAKGIGKYSKKLDITSIAGGGDTISVIKNAKVENEFTYISKAGGAFLEWLEGKSSPGVDALKKNN